MAGSSIITVGSGTVVVVATWGWDGGENTGTSGGIKCIGGIAVVVVANRRRNWGVLTQTS